MSYFTSTFRDVLGLESTGEKQLWDERMHRLSTIIGGGIFDPKFQAAIREEVDRLQTVNTGDLKYSSGAIEICAEERLRLRGLCVAGCALPASGVDATDLRKLGFDTGRRDRSFGILRVVAFPYGWSMVPVEPEPSLSNTSHAVIHDEIGASRLAVMYRHSTLGGTLVGHTSFVA